ncbi:single-stranded DNA-binding protein [Bacillus sp. FSL W8-0116]|uniref:single-stranded DNA-binding protein n=1 Tax=Bacillus sp. FSL W8-0116 TaxID=2978206 RepID=UPI0030F98FFF
MINQVTLVGRLTKDPELRYTTEGKMFLPVILAVQRPYRSQEGGGKADFVLCTFWNKMAENTAKYCSKGSLIGVLGSIQTRNYENKEGKKVYITEVVAKSVQFLSSKPQEETFPLMELE